MLFRLRPAPRYAAVPTSPLTVLRRHAAALRSRAHAPYSRQADATVLLLADGTWVPGVRVESAAFPLTIPSPLNALTTAVAAGRTDIVAAVFSAPLPAWERTFLSTLPFAPMAPVADDAVAATPAEDLPTVGSRLDPFLPDTPPPSPADGIRLARRVAGRALVPASAFPVGCVAVLPQGRLVPGVNVEPPDWTRILCAERAALGTAVTYGAGPVTALYLSCPKDPTGTPCGACRQLLVELAPDAVLWMDRGTAPPDSSPVPTLLPGSFRGQALLRDR